MLWVKVTHPLRKDRALPSDRRMILQPLWQLLNFVPLAPVWLMSPAGSLYTVQPEDQWWVCLKRDLARASAVQAMLPTRSSFLAHTSVSGISWCH